MDDPGSRTLIDRLNFWRLLRWAYGSVAAAFLIWAVAGAWSQLGARSVQLFANFGGVAFILSWIFMAIAMGWLWKLSVARALGSDLKANDWMRVQAAAWAGRYLPGKVGLLAGRAAVLGDGAINTRSLTESVIAEQLLFVIGGLVLCVAFTNCAPFTHWLTLNLGRIAEAPMLFRVAAAFVLFAAAPVLLRILSVVRLRIARFSNHYLLAGYIGVQIVCGVGFWLMLRYAFPGTSVIHPTEAIGLLALANMAGILAVFAPAGIGVREWVIATGLLTLLPLQQGLALGAGLRLLTVLADASFIGLVWFISNGLRLRR